MPEGDVALSDSAMEYFSRPLFIVRNFIEELDARPHKINYEFNLSKLLEDLPEFEKRKGNEVLSDKLLSHHYGELLSKQYLLWCRAKIPEAGLLPCAGSSIEYADEGLF